MSPIDYLYFYRNTGNGALIQATSPCQGEGLMEISKGDYDRAVRAKKIEQDTASAERAEIRNAKRAVLAEKLGITVEDLSLLA